MLSRQAVPGVLRSKATASTCTCNWHRLPAPGLAVAPHRQGRRSVCARAVRARWLL